MFVRRLVFCVATTAALFAAGCGGSSTPIGPEPNPTPSPTSKPTPTSPPKSQPTPTPTPTVALTQGIFVSYDEPIGNTADAITVGPDADLWYTLAPNTIERSDTMGQMAAFPVPGAMPVPAGITSGTDGTLWFTEQNANAIGNVATNGAIVKQFSLANTSRPDRIARGGDGNLYFTEDNATSVTGVITQAGSYHEISLAPNVVADVVAATDGSLWYATASGLLKLTTAGTVTTYPDPQGVGLDEVCAAPDGSFWASSHALVDPVEIYHVSAAGTYAAVALAVPVGGNAVDPVLGIACGAHDVYAVTNYMARIEPALGIFYEFDPTGKLVQESTYPGLDTPFAAPARMVEGPDGDLWFAHGRSLLKWVLH